MQTGRLIPEIDGDDPRTNVARIRSDPQPTARPPRSTIRSLTKRIVVHAGFLTPSRVYRHPQSDTSPTPDGGGNDGRKESAVIVVCVCVCGPLSWDGRRPEGARDAFSKLDTGCHHHPPRKDEEPKRSLWARNLGDHNYSGFGPKLAKFARKGQEW